MLKQLISAHKTVEELVQLFAKGDIAIPEIQRDVVWGDDQVKALMDSISEGYPCGSIILWEPRMTDRKLIRDLIRPEHRAKFLGRPPTYFLLDGQQRLTSLASVFMNRDEFRQMLPDLEPEDLPSRLYGNLKRFPREILATGDGQSFAKTHWVLINDLFDPSANHSQMFEMLSPVQRQSVHEYVQQVRNFQFPVQIIQGRDYRTVGEIFARVNSSGTTLEGAEIHLARIVPHWKGISAEFRQYRDSLRARDYDLDLTFLMRSITAVECGVGKIEKLADKVGQEKVSKRQLDQTWKRVKVATNKIVRILETDLLLDKTKFFTSKNVLVPLVYYAAQEKSTTLNRKGVQRFFIYSQLSQFFSESTEARLTRSLKTLRDPDYTVREGLNELVKNVKSEARQEYYRLKIKASDINGSPSKNVLVLLMYILMRKQGATDFGDGKRSLSDIGPKEMQLHHIFPFNYMMTDKSALRWRDENEYTRSEYRWRVNDIANLTFINQPTNAAIGDQEPWHYLPLFSTKANRKAHFIPEKPELWRSDRYGDFLAARRALLAVAMNRFLKSIN